MSVSNYDNCSRSKEAMREKKYKKPLPVILQQNRNSYHKRMQDELYRELFASRRYELNKKYRERKLEERNRREGLPEGYRKPKGRNSNMKVETVKQEPEQ